MPHNLCRLILISGLMFPAALIPLCENMPSGCATKPGDVVTAMNGKTIQVNIKLKEEKSDSNCIIFSIEHEMQAS